ncbi:MAG: hypothetical protein ACYTFX_06250 [Planctomycetota bacterium]|jgi:hypothetical protein
MGNVNVLPGKLRPLGYGQDTTVSAASALPSIPAGARLALIQALTQNVRWRDDGTDPTAAIGYQLAAGSELAYTGNLDAIKFIEEAASAEINVCYYA